MTNRLILINIFVILLFPLVKTENVLGDEREEIRQEMQELRKGMKQMQERFNKLEERLKQLEGKPPTVEKEEIEMKEIEEAIGEDVEESDARQAQTEPAQRSSFLGRAFQTLNPQISVIGTFAAAYFSEDEPTVFAEADPEDTGINLQEIEAAFQAVVDPYFRFDSFFSIGREGIETEEAYATTLLSLPLKSQARVGIMRSKFGRINTQHRHFQDFVTLPLVAANFLGEHLNPTAIEFNLLAPLPWYIELSALVGSPEVEVATFDRDENANNLGRLLYVFHLDNFFEVTEALSLNLGASFATGSNGTEEGARSNLFGADLFAKYRPLKNNPYQEVWLQSEFMYRDADTAEGNLDDYGFYTYLVYKFAKRFNTGIRFGWVDTDDQIFPEEIHEGEEVFAEYETALPLSIGRQNGHEEEEGHDEGELGLLGRQFRISPMLTFNPSEFSRIRLQYDYTDFDYADDEHALFLQFQYSIGAHGAHPF